MPPEFRTTRHTWQSWRDCKVSPESSPMSAQLGHFLGPVANRKTENRWAASWERGSRTRRLPHRQLTCAATWEWRQEWPVRRAPVWVIWVFVRREKRVVFWWLNRWWVQLASCVLTLNIGGCAKNAHWRDTSIGSIIGTGRTTALVHLDNDHLGEAKDQDDEV